MTKYYDTRKKFYGRVYYKIDELPTIYGLMELWEDSIYGDEAAAVLTLDGKNLGMTVEDIRTAGQELGYNL